MYVQILIPFSPRQEFNKNHERSKYIARPEGVEQASIFLKK